MEKSRIAVIRIHGKSGLKKGIKSTLNMLRLYNKHNCAVIPNTDAYVGMIKKAKNYITWGEINEETLKLLLERRGKLARKQSLTEQYVNEKLKLNIADFSKQVFEFKKELSDLPGLKLFFKLNPPKGGFERGGIKAQFASGGVLGYRKDKINELIKKMM